MAVKRKTISEEWFERCLHDHGIEGGETHHPDLGVSRRPDYRITRGSDVAICEVKEFTTSGMHRRLVGSSPRQPMSLSNEEVFGGMRRKISDAAEQLKPLRNRGEALVVVLANPHHIHVPLGRADEIVASMYGNQGYSMPINVESGESGPGEHVFLRDGALTAKHRYMSAIATLHRGTLADEAREDWLDANRHRWEEIEDPQERALAMLETKEREFDSSPQEDGDFYFVRVYSTISTMTGEAIPVPRELFNGRRDQYWALNESYELELVHGESD